MITRTETLTEASAPAFAHEGSLVDWPAIFAGGVVTAGVTSIFTTFGVALGLATVSPYEGDGSPTLALIAIGLWVVWTTVTSVMVGAYITGRMRRRVGAANADAVSVRDGVHGLAVWGLAILVGIWLLGAATDTATNAAAEMAPAVTQAVTGTEVAPAVAADATATTTPATPAAQAVEPEMTKAEMAAAAKKVKNYSILAAFVSAASLLIAAAAAYWAAGLGGRHRDEDRVFARFGTWL